MCVFLQELLHFAHCKLLYCFGSKIFYFIFLVFGKRNSSCLVFIFSFSFASFLSALLVNVILFYFGIFALVYFLFLFLPFPAALSVYVTRLLVKGTFSILVKGLQRVSVCPLGKRIKNKKKQVRLLVTRI